MQCNTYNNYLVASLLGKTRPRYFPTWELSGFGRITVSYHLISLRPALAICALGELRLYLRTVCVAV